MVSSEPLDEKLERKFESIDVRITRWLARHGIAILRVALGIVFLWFGVLKFFPGLSPAHQLAAQTISVLTFGIVTPAVSVPVLALWECVIGIGLISGRFMRLTILLLLLQMLGTLTPLILFPSQTWQVFLISPTLEGQYIIKNIVLVSAALVIGATVRGGYVLADPNECR